MSDLELILWILAAFYAYECAYWVRPGAFVFRSHLGEAHGLRTRHEGAILRNDHGGYLFGNLLPLGESVLSQQWPVSLSPDGVYPYVHAALTPDGRPEPQGEYLPFDGLRSPEVFGEQVQVNGRRFVKAGSPPSARFLAALIQKLAALPRDCRAGAIDAALARSVDSAEIARQFRETRRHSALLKLLCTALFGYLFGLVPALVIGEIPYRFTWLLFGYLALLALVLVTYVDVHRRLGSPDGVSVWKHLGMMLISPAETIHARNSLFRDLFCGYHPLAVVHALGSPAVFRDLAQHVLLDMRFPLPPVCPPGGADARAAEAWFRDRLNQALIQFIRQTGADPDELTAPPRPESPECRSYCPRCRGQYVISKGTCSTCELPLEPFGPGEEMAQRTSSSTLHKLGSSQ